MLSYSTTSLILLNQEGRFLWLLNSDQQKITKKLDEQ